VRGHVGQAIPSFLPAPFFIHFQCPHSSRNLRESVVCGCHITIEVSRGAYLYWNSRDDNPIPEGGASVATCNPFPEVSESQAPSTHDLMGVFQALTRQPTALDFNKLDESNRPDTG